MNNNIKEKTISNFLWRFAERCGAQGVSFVVSVILARLVAPEAYGTIALITVFTKIMQVFVDSGLGNALIQKKDADDTDFSSVFYFNFALCVVLYVLMYISAPFIADFYLDQDLTLIIRVVSLTLVISGVKNVQQAYVSKQMIFKRFFFATLGGTIFSAIVGIIMAYYGLGVWALVVQMLLNSIVDTFILWITVKWRPKLLFSYKKLNELLHYGWKLLVIELTNTVYVDARQLIIGKLYSSSDLAYYNKGLQIPNLIMDNVNVSINSVLFPTMSSVQDDMYRVKQMTRQAIRVGLYLISPMMIGLFVCSREVVELVYSSKWLSSVPFLKIFAIYYIYRPIESANRNAIKAMGKSDVLLWLEVINKVIGVGVLLVTMWFSPYIMAISLLATEAISSMLYFMPNRKTLGYKVREFVLDCLNSIWPAILMGIVVSFISKINDIPLVVALLAKILIGIVFYIIVSVIFKNEVFAYLLAIIKEHVAKKKT